MNFEKRIKTILSFLYRFLSEHSISSLVFLGVVTLSFAVLIVRSAVKGYSDDFYLYTVQNDNQRIKIENKLNKTILKLNNKPDDIHFLLEAGILCYRLGKNYYPQAVEYLEKARDGGITDINLFYYLGYMYQSEGLNDFAIKEYVRFLNNKSDNYSARMYLAKAYYSVKKYSEASEQYKLLYTKRTNDFTLIENYIYSLQKAGKDYKNIINNLSKKGKKGKFLALFTEGKINYENENFSSSFNCFGKILKTSSAQENYLEDVLFFYASSAYKIKNIVESKEKIKELLKLNPSNEKAKILLSKIEKNTPRKAKNTAKKPLRKKK